MKTNIVILYYCFVMVLFYTGWLVFKSMRRRRNYHYTFRQSKMKFAKNTSSKDSINALFTDVGFQITVDKYNLIRLIIFIILIVIVSLSFYNSEKLRLMIGFILAGYLLTIPILKVGTKDSPFSAFMNLMKTMQSRKKDIELYRILIQLKNIAVTQHEKPYSADYTINQLIKFSKLTKKALINFLMFYNLGKEEEAYERFTQDIHTKMGNEVGMILLKLDKLNPLELIDQIDIIKERTREKHVTEKHKKQNAISDFIYLPIIIPVFILFLNFIMITIWIPKIESSIFFG